MKLDHIGIAVHSIEKALRSYQVAMGLEMEAAIDVEEQKGVHHICFKVEDLDRKLAAFRKAGIQILPNADGTGYEGRRIAFLHPRSTHGVLIELVEE